jgi:SAM-dependent methyltransferase
MKSIPLAGNDGQGQSAEPTASPKPGRERKLERSAFLGLVNVQRAVRDAIFQYRRGNQLTLGQRLTAYPALAAQKVHASMRDSWQDAVFDRFTGLNEDHYSDSGRGYSGLASDTLAERKARFNGQFSRLRYFADTFPDFMAYEDGDTFLDLGCGTGQNIVFLLDRYPRSRVIGVDLNRPALALIRDSVDGNRVELIQGNVADEQLLRDILLESVDHAVMSHSFSLMIAHSLADTRSLRQRVTADLLRSCRKSVVVLDAFAARDTTTITVEQRSRAAVSDDVLSYFSDDPHGRAVLAQSDRTQAVMYRKGDHRSVRDVADNA